MKKKRRKRAPARRSQQWGPLLLIGVGLALLAFLGWQYLGSGSGNTAQAKYDPNDVVYDQPMHGVHEMEPSTEPPPFLPKDGPQPRIEIPVRFLDLGEVPPSAEPEVTFVIRNTGDAPLTISRMYTTCGCTTADLTSSVIPPGKVALLTVRFDADYHDVRGETVRRGVILENNDRSQPQAEVWIQVKVSS